MAKSRVAVLRTSPETVIADYKSLMRLADYRQFLPKENETALKINTSWHYFYPACSTTPWQLDGVISTLLEDGYPREKLYGCQNRTVVVSARRGEIANHHKQVLLKYGLRNIHLYEKGEEWIRFTPKAEMRVLQKVYPEGIRIPKRLVGSNIIHLPTMKTHVFTQVTGAMKNAFGGLLFEKRHWTHGVIHETLVDLLAIQKEIHPGLFAVMDGTFAGDGPGPRCMAPYVKNYILASSDMVAIDAVAARMMGFDPLAIRFIRLAHEQGLGCGDMDEIEVVGEDITNVNFHFHVRDTFASRGQKAIYWGPLRHLEHLLLRTPVAPWSYFASFLYHDVFWYNLVGRWRVRRALRTGWGQLFKRYGNWPADRDAPSALSGQPQSSGLGALTRRGGLGLALSGFLGRHLRGRDTRDKAAQVPGPGLNIPPRASDALTGSQFAESVATMTREETEHAIRTQLLGGNLPEFLRHLIPIEMAHKTSDGVSVTATIFVMPEYLAIGSDSDFLRIPMNLYTARAIADRFHCMLPTRKIVDAVYDQSARHFTPQPLPAGPQMSSTGYYRTHNAMIDRQSESRNFPPRVMVSGHKKDVVLTNRLASQPGQIAIYGWHRGKGDPIQPLSTVHGAHYADYSHGIRLVSQSAIVNGKILSVQEILQDSRFAGALSDEGPMRRILDMWAGEPSA